MELVGATSRIPHFTTRDDHARLILTQLYREQIATGRHSALYSEVCNEAGVPTAQRVGLLDRLVREQYLTQENYGLVRLTESGKVLATAPWS